MKKRKILFLLPVAALILSGCTFQEGWETVSGFFTNNVYEPVKGWVENLLGIKHEEKKEEKKEEQGSDDPGIAGDDDPVEVPDTVIGSIENPISVADFQTQIDALIDYAAVEENKTEVDSSHLFFVKAKVTGSTALNEYKEINFLNMVDCDDSSKQVTGYWTVVDSSITEDFSAKDSLKGREVVVKGYGALYKKVKNNQETKTYELMKKDNDHKSTLVKVFDKESVPGANYGSLENPLTVSEAKATIDVDNPTSEKVYVTGIVTAHDAWDTGYKNVFKLYLSDGENTIYLFKCSKFPADVTTTSITQDMFKGKVMVVSGTGELYQGAYELTDSEVHSISDVKVDSVELSKNSIELEVGEQAVLTATVNPSTANQEVEWSVVSSDQTTAVAKYEDGKVIALAEGTATVTATSVADPTKSASCTVTVAEATKTLQSIAFSGEVEKTAYNEDEAYSIAGLKVMAHYDKGEDVDVTGDATIALDKEVAAVGDTSFKVTASYGTADSIEKDVAVTVAEVNQIAEAYAAAVALANKAESTEEYIVRGVVTAKRGNEYFIQSGDYGFDIYNPNNNEFAIGKMVRVKSTVKNFNRTYETGTISSATVTGDGTVPSPVIISSAADQQAARLNLLAQVEGEAKADVTVGTSDLSIVLKVGNDDITVYVKKNQLGAQGLANLGSVKAGDTLTFTNLITGAYNDNLQLLACDNTNLTVDAAPAKVIDSITSVTGPESVTQNGTVSANEVTVVVQYTDGSSGNAVVTSVSCDTTATGSVTGDVTIEGWNETLHFTTTVVAPQAGEVTVTFDADSMIANPSGYSGGSVKLTSQAIDSVLTVSVDATDSNSGKIYIDNNNGAQIRLYKSGSGKLVVTAKSGYEITAAVAISAPKGSNWWVAGSQTNMEIATDKASASIGGSADTIVYEVTITYQAK